MEENVNETQQNIHEFFKRLLFERDEKIRQLELKVKQDPGEDNVWKDKYHQAMDTLDAQKAESDARVASLVSQNNGLKEVLNKQQSAQKESKSSSFVGNLLWTLAFVALGAVAGFFVHKWFFTPKDDRLALFEKFRNDNQFNYEFELSQGRIAGVEESLSGLGNDPKYGILKPELEFTRKLLAANRRKFEELGFKPEGGTGMALSAPSDEPVIVDTGKKKTLSVVDVETLTIRAEATTKSEKLGTLQKGEQAVILDRTNNTDKLKLPKDGQPAVLKDYWYKIETKSGIEGWVFGHFTTRSINTYELEAPPASATSPTDTTAAKPAPPAPTKTGGGG